MKNGQRVSIAGLMVLLLCVYSCSNRNSIDATVPPVANKDLYHFNFSVEPDSAWTNIFKRTSGWFGGDGIFVIPQKGLDRAGDDTSTIVFSDTMIGEVENGKPRPGFKMIHNSVALLQGADPAGKNIQFYWDQKPSGEAKSIFIPATPASRPGDYYWLGDGFVNTELNNSTYIFGYRVKDIKTTTGFNFEQVGNTFIIIPSGSKPPYRDQRQIDVPFFSAGNGPGSLTFGSGILVNTKAAGATNGDGYVYIYGVKGKDKGLIVSRVVPRDFEHFSEWRFWDGNNWVPEMGNVAAVTNRVSNELSVSMLPDGRYALFFQVDGVSSTVAMRLGNSPVGPFGPIINVYDCKADLEGKDIFAYNAKAHPALSKAGELLVSYNVNSFNFLNDIQLHPNLYRPRFIRVKLL
jgi:hypothetical protein